MKRLIAFRKFFLFALVLLLCNASFANDTLTRFATAISAPGSSWKYLADGSNLGATSWKLISYSDASWPSGNSELGYGDGDENTTLGYGGNSSNKFITTYFRKAINIVNPSAYASFSMSVKRDDGIIVFVNGNEVYRNNLAASPTYTTLATLADDDGETILTATIPTSSFIAGNNLIAVEIHQTSVTSSDITFDMALVGITPPPAPFVTSSGSAVGTQGSPFSYTITATNSPTSFGATGLPSGLSVNVTSGLISGSPTASGTFVANISAKNAGGTGTKGLVITINVPSAPVITSSGTASGSTGSAFSYIITASNSPASYGATGLPAGLSVNTATGAISGTPSTAGTYNTTVSATNPAGTGTKGVVITISSLPVPVITSSGTATGIIGTNFSYTITASNAPSSYGASGLPSGLTVNSSNGMISGVANATGVFNATIRATNASGTGNKALAITINKPDTFINFASGVPSPAGSSWKYLDNGANLGGTTWKLSSFNDSSWKTGNSELGYGDGDENTIVGYGGNASAKYITTWFRKVVNIPNPTAYSSYKMEVKRDDGIVVYINGTEAYRNNLTASPVYTTLATNATDDGETILSVVLPPSSFVAGNNVIAVEIHQTNATSTDISFDMRLSGITAGGAVLTRGPYLQMGNQTAITIRWRTDVATDSKVTWGTSFGTYTNTVTDASSTTEHIVRITGLTADKKYYYTIGSSLGALQATNTNYFVTAPGINTRKLRFVAIGDCGNNSTNQVNVKNTFLNYIGSNTIDAMLLLGDNAYNSGLDNEFQSNFFDIYKNDLLKYNKLYPAPGNHDYGNTQTNSGVRNNAYYNSFSLPAAGECGGVPSGTEAYYSFDIGDVHFVSLDSYGKENSNTTRIWDTAGAQITWLKSDLAANTKKWVIVYFHHPPHTKTSHNSDTDAELRPIREKVTPILERYGVDLILCGHAHGYERSYLLKGYTTVDSAFNKNIHTPNGDTLSAVYDGTANSCPYTYKSGVNHGSVYVVSGSAGQIGGTSAGYPHNAMHYSNSSNGGCFYFEVDSNRLDAKFISFATAPTPLVRDQFTIFKDVNKTQNISVVQNSPLTLKASWRGSYKWPNNGGATTQSVVVNTASTGSFSYKALDQFSCIKDSFRVTVTPAARPLTANELISDESPLSIKQIKSYANGQVDFLIHNNQPGDVQLKLYELSGKLIKHESIWVGNNMRSIHMQVIPGVYVMHLSNNKGERATAKVIAR